MQCEKCDGVIDLIILASDALEIGQIEDYAQLLYPEIAKHNIPVWVLEALYYQLE